MRRTHALLLLALVLVLGGSVSLAEAQSPAQCPMEAWVRAGGPYTSVQGVPRGGFALGSPADRVALFQALGGHERDATAIGNGPSRVASQNVPASDELTSTVVGTDTALIVRIEDIPGRVAAATTGAGAQLRAVHAERCMSFSMRVTSAVTDAPLTDNNALTQ